MATAATIKKNIAKLEAALKSKATPKSLKSKLETQLVKSKAELSGLNKGTKPKTSSTKSTQSALKSLKELVNKNKKYKNYKGAGVDLERDADRPAKPIGRRTAKASGKTYYEYRANRIDVKQPPKRYPKLEKGGYMAKGGEVGQMSVAKSYWNNFDKKQRIDFLVSAGYSKTEATNLSVKKWDSLDEDVHNGLRAVLLADGGMMAKGGSLSSIKEEYDENEDNNAHSENVVLLAKHFGNKEDLVEAKRILDLHEKEGHLTSENGKKRQELHLKLIEKARTAMDKEGIEFAKGGYMADGGFVAVGEKDGYWTIMSKPTTEEKANEVIKMGVPRGEVGKVVTLKEAKEHKKVIGAEYLEKGGYFAKGGMVNHGLEIGDLIDSEMDEFVFVKNKGENFMVNLNMGTRQKLDDRYRFGMGGEMHRTQE
jgi:hypothetical protein